ncbi:hypothetical protein KUW00_19430 [Halomonas sp. DP5N14-9]|uniref:hypothetical protein n=1 Tax=Halomonas sp. DP5N14-9 TaxID=2859075 RepID=UPI001C9A2B38|nr:hypothetical protein [Halomonas sp. DP5N14-9]MBY5943053.1 hypothetical protein [Halomonas sp. DP5N14-9]
MLEAEAQLDLALIADWLTRERLTAGGVKERLAAARLAKARGWDHEGDVPEGPSTTPAELAQYGRLVRSSGHQEVTHGAA